MWRNFLFTACPSLRPSDTPRRPSSPTFTRAQQPLQKELGCGQLERSFANSSYLAVTSTFSIKHIRNLSPVEPTPAPVIFTEKRRKVNGITRSSGPIPPEVVISFTELNFSPSLCRYWLNYGSLLSHPNCQPTWNVFVHAVQLAVVDAQ